MKASLSHWAKPVSVVVLVIVGLALALDADLRFFALMPLIVAMLLAFTGRSTLGTVESVAAGADPAEVKRYRRDHPGATISEATQAVAQRS